MEEKPIYTVHNLGSDDEAELRHVVPFWPKDLSKQQHKSASMGIGAPQRHSPLKSEARSLVSRACAALCPSVSSSESVNSGNSRHRVYLLLLLGIPSGPTSKAFFPPN